MGAGLWKCLEIGASKHSNLHGLVSWISYLGVEIS